MKKIKEKEGKRVVRDEETGIDLVYNYDSDYGWSFVASGYEDRETMRQAAYLSLKYWPEVPEEDRQRVEENNAKIVAVCRSIRVV